MGLTCSNCETQLPEEAKYCLQCGQSTKSLRKPFVDFLKDSFWELLDIDGRLSLTVRTLLFKMELAIDVDEIRPDRITRQAPMVGNSAAKPG